MLPLEVSEFGVFLGVLLLVSIESTYIQYTYLIAIVFQGKCFITIFVALFLLPTTFQPSIANYFLHQILSFIVSIGSRYSYCCYNFMLEQMPYMKHFMSQWLSTGVGLGESHCDIKCFIYSIHLNTNLVTVIVNINAEPIETMKLNILDAKVVSREVESECGWQQRSLSAHKYSDKTFP